MKLEGTCLSFLFCIYFPYILTYHIFQQWNNQLDKTRYFLFQTTTLHQFHRYPPISVQTSRHSTMHEYTSRSRDKKQSVPSPPSIDFRSWIRARQTEVRISLDLFCLELPASFLLFFPVCRPCCSSTVACRHPLWKESKESWNSLACKSRFPSQSADLAEPNISLDYRQPRLYSLKGAPSNSSPANLRVSRICDWLFVGSGSVLEHLKVYGMGQGERVLRNSPPREFTWFSSAIAWLPNLTGRRVLLSIRERILFGILYILKYWVWKLSDGLEGV